MYDWLGGNRRISDREPKELKFRCRYSGRQCNALTIDVSSGGAFVTLDRIVRPGGVLVLEPITTAIEAPRNVLVAEVVYYKIKPRQGAGVRWVKLLSEGGLHELRAFLRDLLGVEVPEAERRQIPDSAMNHPISFDFRTGVLNLEKRRTEGKQDEVVSMLGMRVSQRAMDRLGLGNVKVVQSEAPRQKRAILREEDVFAGRDDGQSLDPLAAARRLEEWMRLRKQGHPVDLPVNLAFGGRNVEGRALSASISRVFVSCASRLPEPGTRVLMRLLLPVEKKRFTVIIVAEVEKAMREGGGGGGWGASLRIVTLNEGDDAGVFKRYLASL